jgi:rod shape-determining protein MreD
MQNKNLLKWTAYTLVVLLAAILQGTPNLFIIAGVMPLLIIPCVIAISMFEGETPGAVFGILGGLIWDIESGRAFGYNALFLMIMCIAAALLIQNLFRNTIASAFIFCICAVALHEFITWFFFIYLTGDERFVFAFLRIILPTAAYTVIFVLPIYFLVRRVSRRFFEAQ